LLRGKINEQACGRYLRKFLGSRGFPGKVQMVAEAEMGKLSKTVEIGV
jgi:hypothetical protein